MIDLTAALRLVTRALDSLNVRYMVVGSTAAAAWGLVRATRDVDLVMSIDSASGADLLALLDDPDLYLPIEEARAALTHGGAFNVLHPATGGKVDVFVVRPDDDFEMMRLERRRLADVLGDVTWIASPEDVILAKLRWRRVSRSEVPWSDCAAIAATQALDVAHMTAWAKRLGVADDLADLLDQVRSGRRPSDGGGGHPDR